MMLNYGAPTTGVNARALGPTSQLWSLVADYLVKPLDFNHFVRSCKLFLQAGTQAVASDDGKITVAVKESVVFTLYQRLCRLDDTLPVCFSTDDHLNEYLAALKKVQLAQEKEIAYLRKHHPQVVKMNLEEVKLDELPCLNRLEAINQIIDDININVIVNSSTFGRRKLNLQSLGITRLPESLMAQYRNYFNNLRELNCSNNKIRVLNIKNLPRLQIFDCESNGMKVLKLENLPSLEHICFNNNYLRGTLDLRSFKKLIGVAVHNNKLKSLLLDGLLAMRFLDCSNNHLKALTVNSSVVEDLNCSRNYLDTLSIEHLDNLAAFDEQSNTGLNLYTNRLSRIPDNLVAKFGKKWANECLDDQREDVDIESDTDVDSETEEQRWESVLHLRARVIATGLLERGPLLPFDNARVSQVVENLIREQEVQRKLIQDQLAALENSSESSETQSSENSDIAQAQDSPESQSEQESEDVGYPSDEEGSLKRNRR
ncbi:MAG: hypothetical protein JSR17_03650 [Proteobacteria bacterium]|nr:hypothetical protein [Pseudomonadota bacterium]